MTTIMHKKNGQFALIEQLMADGIYYMFGNPGTVEEGFLDSLGYYYPEFQYILALQETIAVAAADGYARVTKSQQLFNYTVESDLVTGSECYTKLCEVMLPSSNSR